MDEAPGPGWWLASDGRWYPPHLHPDTKPAEESLPALSAQWHAPALQIPAGSRDKFGYPVEGPPVFGAESAPGWAPGGGAADPAGAGRAPWAPLDFSSQPTGVGQTEPTRPIPDRPHDEEPPWKRAQHRRRRRSLVIAFLVAIPLLVVAGVIGVHLAVDASNEASVHRSPGAVATNFMQAFDNGDTGAMKMDVLPSQRSLVGQVVGYTDIVTFVVANLQMDPSGSSAAVEVAACPTSQLGCVPAANAVWEQTITARKVGGSWYVDWTSLPICSQGAVGFCTGD